MTKERTKAWNYYFESGDRDALIRAYSKTIHYIAWSFYGDDHDDAYQVGMIGMLKAIANLDMGRLKNADAWVSLNVRSAIMNMRKRPDALSLDAPLPSYPTTEDEYPSDVTTLFEGMSVRTAHIIQLIHLHHYRRTEIAKLYGLSSMRIGQIEKEGLAKLREVLTEA